MFNIFINNSLKKEAKTWDEVTKYLGLLGYDIRSIRKVEQGRWVVAYDANSATIIQVWTAEKIPILGRWRISYEANPQPDRQRLLSKIATSGLEIL